RNAVLIERRDRLARAEARIQGLIGFIADGDKSDYIRTTLYDLEAQAKAEKAAIADLERQAAAPIPLPTPEEAQQRACDLEARLREDPVAGREALRRMLKGGHFRLDPQPDGVYVARTDVLPLVLLLESIPASQEVPRTPVYFSGSGGKI